MKLDIYHEHGPAGIAQLDLRENTVNLLWFKRAHDWLQSHRTSLGSVFESGSGAGGAIAVVGRAVPDARLFAGDIFVPGLRTGRRLHPHLSFIATDGCALGVGGGAFDAVLVHDVLEHVDSPSDMLRETHRVLRDGGALLLFVPCEGQPGTIHRLYRALTGRNPKQPKGHVQDLTITEVVGMLETAGFAIVQRKYSFHLIGQLSDIIVYVLGDRKCERIVTWAAGYLSRVAYVESRLLDKVPGLCLEIVAIKKH